jgi:hypothetical protein
MKTRVRTAYHRGCTGYFVEYENFEEGHSWDIVKEGFYSTIFFAKLRAKKVARTGRTGWEPVDYKMRVIKEYGG